MSDATIPQEEEQQPAPRWQPLSAVDRRVAGALVEKAKTTPAAYPLSLNAVATACNQKSNRAPLMNLDPDDLEESLDRLRKLGAVGVIEGHGRVSKYRHYLYDWLGVDKVEIAVVAELLLRGPQTIGELRGRAARMEPIRDLAALEPVLASLKSKGLVVPLTREGRGHVVTHALYRESELESLKKEYAAGGDVSHRASVAPVAAPAPSMESPPPAPTVDGEIARGLNRAVEELRSQVAQLRSDLDDLASSFDQTNDELRRLRNELGS